jgi:hypothetical protein
MAVSSEKDVVSNVVGVKMLKSSVSVGHITLLMLEHRIIARLHFQTHTPVVTRKDLAITPILSDTREDDLVANDSPSSTSVLRLTKGPVEPVLLTTSHEGTAGVVPNHVDILVIPVEGGDAAVVVSCVEDDQIEKLAHLEGSPDT